MRLVINVQPFNLMLGGKLHCFPNQLAPNALAAVARVDTRVEEKRMRAAVPGQVHEPDQLVMLPSSCVAKASGKYRIKARRTWLCPNCQPEGPQRCIARERIRLNPCH